MKRQVKNVIKNKKLKRGVVGKQGQINSDFVVQGVEGLDIQSRDQVLDTAYLDFVLFMLDEIYQDEGADALLENHWTDAICEFATAKGVPNAEPVMVVDFIKNSEYPTHDIDKLREILSIESDSSGGHIVKLNQPLFQWSAGKEIGF